MKWRPAASKAVRQRFSRARLSADVAVASKHSSVRSADEWLLVLFSGSATELSKSKTTTIGSVDGQLMVS
jgi:hypothetical protein